VQLRATNPDAFARLLDHPDVRIRIVLQPGATAAVTFGVGDALSDPYVARLSVFDVCANARGIFRKRRLDAIGGGEQRHDRRVRHVREQVARLVQLHLFAELVCRPRHFHERANRTGPRIVEAFVAARRGFDGDAEDRMAGQIVYLLALEERLPAVVQ
jgi:hypothetical protein